MLKKIIVISNSNLIKNADSLFSTRNVDEEVEWIGMDKKDYLKTDTRCPINF